VNTAGIGPGDAGLSRLWSGPGVGDVARIADDLDVGYGLLGIAVAGEPAAYSPGALTSAPGRAIRTISLGLIAAAFGGAAGNAVVGLWGDTAASFRGPVLPMSVVAGAVVAWYAAVARAGSLDSPPPADRSSPQGGVG